MGFKVKTNITEINNNDTIWGEVLNNSVVNDIDFLVNNIETKKIVIGETELNLVLSDLFKVEDIVFMHIFAETLIQIPDDIIETVQFEININDFILTLSQFQLCNIESLNGIITINVPAQATEKKALLTIIIGSK